MWPQRILPSYFSGFSYNSLIVKSVKIEPVPKSSKLMILIFLFIVSHERFSPYIVLFISIFINWPVIRWLDDRQWYREWKETESKGKAS